MNRYRELFALPSVWALVLAAFPARIAYGMVGLSIFFKTQHETHSIALAGLAIGLNSLASSTTAGLRGSLMDKFGQKWPLRIFVPGYATLLLTLNTIHDKHLILIVAFTLGLSAPPINLSIRPLWKSVVPADSLRIAYATDTAVMSFAGVIGPVLATALALSSHPGSALATAGILMFLGGISLSLTKVSSQWVPEKKERDSISLWRHKALQLLMIEGCFIGFGWGLFSVAVPAFATLEHVAYRTAWIVGAMGVCNIIGGLLAGLVSKSRPALTTMRRTYLIWFIVSIPIALTYPGWSMAIAGGLLGLVGGALQVFYWEVMEAVRPKGSPTAMMGWLWTVEGSFMSLGAAMGGWLSDTFSPRACLATTTVCVLIGYLIFTFGRGRLAAADRIPTVAEDLQAMKDNASTTN